MYQAALDSGSIRLLFELAKTVGLSYHRVSQVLDLLTLAPEIQAALDVPFEQLPARLSLLPPCSVITDWQVPHPS